MKKIISLVLSLSMVGTLCTNTVYAAGVDKVEIRPDGSKVIYVSSENVENYKRQLLKPTSGIEIADKLNAVAPYFLFTTFISSIGWIVFNIFFDKNDINISCIENQNFSTVSTVPSEFSDTMPAEEKIGLIKSLAQKFKKQYYYTDGAISSQKQKSMIGKLFLLTIPATLLSFFLGAVLPNVIKEHYRETEHGKNLILNSISDDYAENCGMKVTFDKNNKFYSIGPQNCDKY